MLNFLMRIICLLSWTTIFFLPRRAVKRYFPVTIMSGLFTVTIVFIGSQYNFWGASGKTRKGMWNHLSLVLGPFAVANMWIFHLTYGKFGLYFLINLINNLLYSWKTIPLVEKANYVSYVKFTRIHHFIVTMIESLLLYRYQMFFDKPYSKRR